MRIVWSTDANNDLAQIWNYLAQEASIARADDQVRKIEGACQLLSEWPLAGRSRDTIIPGLRTIVATPYVIFYRVSDTIIQIIRVLDSRRDIDTILAEMP